MTTKWLSAVFVAWIVIASSPHVHAGMVNVVGYDILNADVSGSGGWMHTYTGTITPLGGSLANYSDGTGTMADGVLAPLTSANTQIFFTPSTSIVEITLYLDGYYTVDQMDFYGGDPTNGIPGALTGMDVTIGGSSASFLTSGFGATNIHTGHHVNDRLVLTGSGLDSLLTDKLILSNFTADYFGLNQFSIGEIVLDGTSQAASVVPEPSSLTLLAVGAASLAGCGWRRRKRRSAV